MSRFLRSLYRHAVCGEWGVDNIGCCVVYRHYKGYNAIDSVGGFDGDLAIQEYIDMVARNTNKSKMAGETI